MKCHTWTPFRFLFAMARVLGPSRCCFSAPLLSFTCRGFRQNSPCERPLGAHGVTAWLSRCPFCWQFCSSENNPYWQDGGGEMRRGGVGGFIWQDSKKDLRWWSGGGQKGIGSPEAEQGIVIREPSWLLTFCTVHCSCLCSVLLIMCVPVGSQLLIRWQQHKEQKGLIGFNVYDLILQFIYCKQTPRRNSESREWECEYKKWRKIDTRAQQFHSQQPGRRLERTQSSALPSPYFL